jgi:hypothetical protein
MYEPAGARGWNRSAVIGVYDGRGSNKGIACDPAVSFTNTWIINYLSGWVLVTKLAGEMLMD